MNKIEIKLHKKADILKVLSISSGGINCSNDDFSVRCNKKTCCFKSCVGLDSLKNAPTYIHTTNSHLIKPLADEIRKVKAAAPFRTVASAHDLIIEILKKLNACNQ